MAHVESFLQRIERATVRGRSRLKVLGIIAAPDFDRDAWTAARRRGLITVSFRQTFGDEALEAMAHVEKLLNGLKRDTKAQAEGRFKTFSLLLNDLKTNPIVVSLRSIGFEALGGFILRSQGYEQVEMGRIVQWKNSTRDVDLFGIRGDELRVVECKAYHRKKSVLDEDVRKFFTETLPAIKQWLRDTGRKFSRCTAEIWTTGPLGNRARYELYNLKRPKNDEWKLVPMDKLKELIPAGIKTRSVELLNSIAMTETPAAEEVEPEESVVEEIPAEQNQNCY